MIRYAIVIFLCGLLAYTNSQVNVPDINDIINKGPSLRDFDNLSSSAVPDFNEATNLFKQKCEKNGHEGVFENFTEAKNKLTECLKSFVNITELQAEMEKYKPNGDLDYVFKRYCRKTPKLKSCVNEFTTAIEPCLEPAEKENKKILMDITDSLLSFVCFKEGDRIALFISANGPECLQSKQQEMARCANASILKYIPSTDPANMPTLENLPKLVLGNKECTDIATVQSCIVKELEMCSDPTPANIVDSIFNYILRVTPCKNILPYVNSASVFTTSLLMMTSLIFVSLRLV